MELMNILLELNLISFWFSCWITNNAQRHTHMYVCTCLYVFARGSVCMVASTVLILIWFTLLRLSLGYSISMGIRF